MSLSGYQDINNAVRYAAGDFDFAGTLGDFVGNAEFSYGSEDYKADVSAARSGAYTAPNARSNIWYVLSAIGQDIGEITYANVKNYIDIVSNIDMCKTRALMSMMKNVGMDYSVIGDIDDFPLEVLNLIDIFSIDKKYLLDNDKIKEDLIQDIRRYASNNSQAESRDYYRLFENGFSISTANPEARGKLVLEEDNGYDGSEVAGRFTSFDDLVASGGVYDPALRFVTCRKYRTLPGAGQLSCELRKFSVPSFSDGQYDSLADGYAMLSAGSVVCSAEAEEFENLVAPGAKDARPFASTRPDITVKYDYLSGENQFIVDDMSIDEEKYHDYVKSVFIELLSSYLDMRYNVTSADINEIHPIHFYIKDEYLQNSDYYKNRAQLTSDSMRFKRINNIPYNFNEQRILDDIDAGLDDLDNYDGYERQLLDMEIDRRARRLTYSDMTPGAQIDDYSVAFLSSDNFNDVSNNKTRYSYYRKAKVLEYARFVDNIFALGEIGSDISEKTFKPYRFDADYYVIGDLSTSHIFKYDGLSSLIDQEELSAVAENLTTYTQYIAKLRNKIKLQVRKNYMKGTNNLLIYLINQFLVDYSRTNRLFKTYGGVGQPLAKVYENLSSSDSDDIEIVEYRDDTEYYNLESNRSLESITQSYNNDFKQAYFKPMAGGTISAFDGKFFTFDQIKEFYLSSLSLKNYISDDTDGFIQFISSVFEIGRSDSFMDKRGIFACKLDDGQYTTELWDRLDMISGSYMTYKGYLSRGDYEYPADTVQNQLKDVVENYIGQHLSGQYLSDVSDVYDQYHGEIEQMSSDLTELSTQYSTLVESDGYALYLNKSACKYCYTNGEDDLTAYRHDWYNDNSAVYASQYLIDKLGDLKRFASAEKNMKCYPVLDTLEYIKNTFDRISAQLMSDAEKPSEGYGYVDIESPYLDQEMRSIYAYLESESGLRKSELQGMLANIRQQAQQTKETYDKLDNSFAAAMANYDTGDGTPMGEINTSIFGKCEHFGECTLEKWCKSDSSYEKFYKKHKDDEDYADIVPGILIRETQEKQDKKGATHNVAFYQLADTEKNDKKAKYDRFEVNEDLAGENCAITDDMSLEDKILRVQAWMGQITDGHVEVDEESGDCYIADPVYGYMNAGVLAAVNSIEGDLNQLAKTVDSVVQQITDIGGDFDASGIVSIKDKIDRLQKYLGTEIDGSFSDDVKIKEYTRIKKIISNLSAQYDNLKLVYDAMPSDSEYADYIIEEYKSAFTAENIDALSAYVVKRGIGDKVKIMAEIKQMIDQYNMQQNLYTAVAEQVDAQISGVGLLEPDPYLELLFEYIMNKLIRDVKNKIERAQEHIDSEKLSVYGTIDKLSTQISSQMSAYEHDFEYYFDQYLSTLNFFQRPEYIGAYELFKTYGGTSACYDPYYNYKNIAHPSFQVHPFLWNFVEATGVRDIVSRSFDGLLNEKLERLQIHKYIDGIIGEFGQVVNIWQNNTTDSTGYTTRYEINTHTDEGVEYSPVVDYDGGFYPPAVQSYLRDPVTAVRSVRDGATSKSIAQNVRKALADVQMSALYTGNAVEVCNEIYSKTSLCVEPYYPYSGYMDIVSAFVEQYTVQTSAGMEFSGTKEDLRDMVQLGLSGTFYENYYQHLHIDGDASYREYIAGQLSCEDIYRRIRAIAEDKDAVSDVYDIYKYGLDNLKNIYVLYKKYREPNPTYKEKRNTPGALWIRLKNHPIAFPALLSGGYTEYQVCDITPSSRLNSYLSGVSTGTSRNRQGRRVDFIDIDRYCYDFSFSYDQEAIAMACVNRDAADPIFRTYDYPELVMSIIESKAPTFSTKRKMLCFSNNEGEADDVVSQPGWVPSAAEITSGVSAVCPVYLGAYSPSLKNIRLVYAYKSHSMYNDSGDILSVGLYSGGGNGDVCIMIAKYNENTTGIGYRGNACISGYFGGIRPVFDVTSHEIAFTCDNIKKEKLTFAFPVQRNTTEFVTYNGVTVDIEPNSEGGCIDDPTLREMTSHDVFDEHIAIVHAHFNGQLYQDGTPAFYNLNADMSYQPVYPGYSHKYVKPELSGYENIELLGKSKDIAGSIASVNPNADPYFELSDMLENGVYGRVYENYASAEYGILNSMFIVKQNPAFGENKKEAGQSPIGYADKHYVWNIDLSGNFTDATSSDIAGMNIVMFNTQNMGKNPYFIGKIGDLVTSCESSYVPAYYNGIDSERECMISSLSSDSFSGKFTIAGINRQGYTNSMDNNRIGNIGAIEMRMDMSRLALQILFKYEVVDKEAHIPEGQVRCVFYDDKNLKQFEYYHMLDSYGAVNAYEMLRNRAAYDYVVKGRGWKIIYDSSKDDKFRDKIKSFILDGDGVRQYLDDIDLSQYSFLSDVYLYRDDKLAFKYNEEDMFEYTHSEYHYPFLNRKYPNTIAQYYSTHMNFGVRNQSQSDDQLNLFDESNLFVLNYNEGNRLLSAMGQVAIPIYETDTEDTLRVFEDYLSVYADDNGVSGYNSDRYADDDPRLFQFTHFVAYPKAGLDDFPDYSGTGGRDIPSAFWRHKTVDEFCDSVLAGLDGYQYISRECEHQALSSAVKYVYVTPTAENCSISDILNIQVNYSKDMDGRLTLFFNYANYINTPFVKYADGYFKIDTIDRTYLMLKPGENGELDIVVQARYYVGEELYGYRNIKMLTFKIHNLSDDKPKFYITKIYELRPGELDVEKAKPTAKLGVFSTELDINKYSPEQHMQQISCDVTFTVEASHRVMVDSTVEVVYPAYMIQPVENAGYAGYVVKDTQSGVALVTLKDPDITEFTIRFRTATAGHMAVQYANRRYAITYGRTNIFSVDGRRMTVQTAPGMFMIRNDNTYVMAEDAGREPVGAGLLDGNYTGIYMHNI